MFTGTGIRGDEQRGCGSFREPFPHGRHELLVYSRPLASPLCFMMCKWEGLTTSCLILEPCLGDGPNLWKPTGFAPAVGGIFHLPALTHQLLWWRRCSRGFPHPTWQVSGFLNCESGWMGRSDVLGQQIYLFAMGSCQINTAGK